MRGRYNRRTPAAGRGEPTGSSMSRAVGRNVVRKDGAAKAAGTARYVDDLTRPGLLYARTIRSAIPCGEITRVRLDFDASGFIVVDARDIPGRNVVSLITDDQPCLAEREVRHVAEPILLLAHEDRERLLGAAVEVEYRPGTPVFDAAKSAHVFKHITIAKGDLDEGFRRADLVIEGEYRTGHQEHLYIEPNGMLAIPENGGITVVRFAAVPVLRASRARGAAGPARGQGPRGAGRDRRRLRRQGGVPVDDRRARLPAGAQVGPAGEARLRPRRGHARDDEAPPVRRAPPDRA